MTLLTETTTFGRTCKFGPRTLPLALFFGIKSLRRVEFRPLVTLVTLAALVVCAVGIPLPLHSNSLKPTAEPYPCMDCPCGCNDAETCWRDCCCHSTEEKIAWARDRGITPPAYVLAAVRPAQKDSGCCAKKSCCQSTSCCSNQRIAQSCCAKPARPSCCQNKKRQTSPGVVLAISAIRCQGLTFSLSSLPPTLVNAELDSPELLPLAGSILARDDHPFEDLNAIPETPPPQC